MTTFPVENVSDTVAQLEKGCQSRSKGETAMNAQSSRSHAIFSIILVKEAVAEEWVSNKFENSNFRIRLAQVSNSEIQGKELSNAVLL